MTVQEATAHDFVVARQGKGRPLKGIKVACVLSVSYATKGYIYRNNF